MINIYVILALFLNIQTLLIQDVINVITAAITHVYE